MNVLSNYAVVVPSLHPDRDHLIPFLRDLMRLTPGAVVVIDDGSGDAYADVFALVEQMGCVVLRHAENQGKGRALKTGFRYFTDHLPHLRGVVTADSDGQHDASDIAKVGLKLDELDAEGVSAAALGSRAFDGPGIPAKSRFGNTITTWIVKLLFGRRIVDTQTGLRGFSRELAVSASAVGGERFDYEMNQLLWLLATHHRVVEVPIRTIYHDTSNSISHFRPIRDSVWIYAIILRQFFVFSGVSLLSAAVDLAAYYVLIDYVFGADRVTGHVAVAVALARIISSVVNFVLNRLVVFRHTSPPARAIRRYYILAGAILLASAAGTSALSVLSGGHDMWAKIACDGLLFGVSYLVQRRWVFAETPAPAAASALVSSRQSLR